MCVCVKDEKKKRGSQTLKSARVKKKKKKKKKMLLSEIECEWGNNINVCGVELCIFIILRKVVIYKIYMYGVVSHFDLLHTYVLLEMQVKYY